VRILSATGIYNYKLAKWLDEKLKKNRLFQFDSKLYRQVDGVAMGSPLGLLMANTFMCWIEQKLVDNNRMPSFYHPTKFSIGRSKSTTRCIEAYRDINVICAMQIMLAILVDTYISALMSTSGR
jgi:hypothetical protein